MELSGLSYVYKPNRLVSMFSVRAEFVSATVPSKMMQHFIDYPHELHAPNQKGITLQPQFITLTLEDVVGRAKAVDRATTLLDKVDIYRRVNDAVISAENAFNIVAEALKNLNLNPQFYSNESATVLNNYSS